MAFGKILMVMGGVSAEWEKKSEDCFCLSIAGEAHLGIGAGIGAVFKGAFLKYLKKDINAIGAEIRAMVAGIGLKVGIDYENCNGKRKITYSAPALSLKKSSAISLSAVVASFSLSIDMGIWGGFRINGVYPNDSIFSTAESISLSIYLKGSISAGLSAGISIPLTDISIGSSEPIDGNHFSDDFEKSHTLFTINL